MTSDGSERRYTPVRAIDAADRDMAYQPTASVLVALRRRPVDAKQGTRVDVLAELVKARQLKQEPPLEGRDVFPPRLGGDLKSQLFDQVLGRNQSIGFAAR